MKVVLGGNITNEFLDILEIWIDLLNFYIIV